MTKHKIYCFINAGTEPYLWGLAIGDNGKCLAEHCSSNVPWLKTDLGFYPTESGHFRKHDNYNKEYGDGNWELEWVADVKNHPELKEILKNCGLGQKNPENT